MRPTLWLVPVAALVLTGCSGEPRAELRSDVEAITLAANDGDADAVREEVEDLLSTIRSQIGSGELDRAEGERLRAIALRIAEQAGLLEPEPSPSPSPSPTEESPSPSPSPTEESPSPEPSPTEEEEPEESPEPEPTETEPSPLLEISPAAGEPSPSPSEAAAKKKAAAQSPEPSPQPTT